MNSGLHQALDTLEACPPAAMQGWGLARAFGSAGPKYVELQDEVGGEAEHADLEAGHGQHDAAAAGSGTAQDGTSTNVGFSNANGSFGNANGSFSNAVRSSLRDTLAAQSMRILDLFKLWDEDGSGEIDRKEFRRAIKSLGLEYEVAEINTVFDEFDGDGSGTIEYKELSKALRGGMPSTLDAVLQPGAVGLGPTGMQHKLRSKGTDNTLKKSKLVGNTSIDLESSVPVVQQLRAILTANAARVIDLFREWCVRARGSPSR